MYIILNCILCLLKFIRTMLPSILRGTAAPPGTKAAAGSGAHGAHIFPRVDRETTELHLRNVSEPSVCARSYNGQPEWAVMKSGQ